MRKTSSYRIKSLYSNVTQKIRGARANTLVMDEVAQIPADIINLVILPMMNTKQDPFDTTGRKNHLVMASSAYFQFNHLYDKYEAYKQRVKKNGPDYDPNYGLHVYTVNDMPPGWMDEAIIKEAKSQLTELQYQMEYECLFPPDSDGFFPASLVREARRTSVMVELFGQPNAEYVLGIDPARSGDNFALVVVKVGPPNRVVACYSLNRKTFPEMHDFIRSKIRDYSKNGSKVVRIQMDNGGGGSTLKDYLAEEYPWFNMETQQWETMSAIIDIDDEEQQYMKGERILKMQVFAPQSINSMNFDLRADMEKRRLIIPVQAHNHDKEHEEVYEEIDEMIKELMTIVTTPLKSGFMHFDTPKQRMKKDRYSAFLIGAEGARDMLREVVGPPQSKLARGFTKNSFLNRKK